MGEVWNHPCLLPASPGWGRHDFTILSPPSHTSSPLSQQAHAAPCAVEEI